MTYLIPFFQIDPDLAGKETRTVTPFEPREGVPAGAYWAGRAASARAQILVTPNAASPATGTDDTFLDLAWWSFVAGAHGPGPQPRYDDRRRVGRDRHKGRCTTPT